MFLSAEEIKINKEYLNKGYVIQDIIDVPSLDWISNFFIQKVGKKNSYDSNKLFFDNIHKKLKLDLLNDFRVEVINKINNSHSFREKFYKIAKPLVDMVVGNEVVMQKRISLSVQMPKDDSSLLPIHADTWSGVSPFESVIWLPLVDCKKTKSMFILPPNKSKNIKKIMSNKKIKNSGDLYREVKKDLQWINIKYGQIMIFDHSLPHGNVVNQEKGTRWSMNCRFKSIFTPYADKKIGEYYEPITLKASSRRGMSYKLPK